MALLVIRGDDGRSHLIHSSEIGPQTLAPRSTGWWEDVWSKFDERADSEQSPGVGLSSEFPSAPA